MVQLDFLRDSFTDARSGSLWFWWEKTAAAQKAGGRHKNNRVDTRCFFEIDPLSEIVTPFDEYYPARDAHHNELCLHALHQIA
jgi:hypothetical protein